MKSLTQFIKESQQINETSRAQKARQTVMGTISPKRAIKTFAILTAENPMAQKVTDEENKELMEKFIQNLSVGHYRFFKIRGQYGTKEHSIIVYNIKLSDTCRLGYDFKQQAVIWGKLDYQDNKTVKVLYQLWSRKTEKDKFTLEKETDHVINGATTDLGDMWSEIKRGIRFRIPFFEHANIICQKINERFSDPVEAVWRINRTLNEELHSGSIIYNMRGSLYGRQGDLVYKRLGGSMIEELSDQCDYFSQDDKRVYLD